LEWGGKGEIGLFGGEGKNKGGVTLHALGRIGGPYINVWFFRVRRSQHGGCGNTRDTPSIPESKKGEAVGDTLPGKRSGWVPTPWAEKNGHVGADMSRSEI